MFELWRHSISGSADKAADSYHSVAPVLKPKKHTGQAFVSAKADYWLPLLRYCWSTFHKLWHSIGKCTFKVDFKIYYKSAACNFSLLFPSFFQQQQGKKLRRQQQPSKTAALCVWVKAYVFLVGYFVAYQWHLSLWPFVWVAQSLSLSR